MSNKQEVEPPSANELRAFCYRLLGRREYGVRELELRLRQKFPQAEDLDEFVENLREENLVSDERYAESFVRSRVQRSQGPLKIRAALRAKGVGDSDIQAALSVYDEEWLETARDWVSRHHPGEIDFDLKPKIYRKLMNRGFSHDQAMSALS